MPSAPTTTQTVGGKSDDPKMVEVTVLSGSMSMECSDPAAFLADDRARTGVKEAIAQVAQAPVQYIQLRLSILTRRLHGRHLAVGTVKVEYNVTFPSPSDF